MFFFLQVQSEVNAEAFYGGKCLDIVQITLFQNKIYGHFYKDCIPLMAYGFYLR